MLEFLKNIDVSFFIFVNSLHLTWADQIMFWLSQKYWLWIPLYILVFYLIIKRYGSKSWLPVLFLILLITLNDQISSSLIKPAIERFRPTHELALQGLVHTVNGYTGGKYGFVSSHAANSFALFFFCLLLFRLKWLTITLMVYTLIVSYSRVYLGVHYPGDIIGGWILGLILSLIVYQFLKFVYKKIYRDELHSVAGK